jgi:glutathione S-transferase
MVNSREQQLEIFWGSGSPFAWRVLICAELKNIPFESRQLQFSGKEHKSPPYLTLNERGEVPTMRDGNFVLTESLAIMTYLDAKHPNPPLFGRSAVVTGLIWRWISIFVYHFEPLSDRIVLPVFNGVVDACQEEIELAAEDIHAELSRIERSLKEEPWLGVSGVSAADIVGHSDLEFFLRIAGRDELKRLSLGFGDIASRYPAISAWRDRTTRIEGYERAYPPHW